MGMERSPKSQKRAADFRKRQEKRWAKKSGPVTVRFVDPATLRPATAPPPSPADAAAPRSHDG